MYPILFTVPGIDLPIHAYGVMLGTAMVTGWFLVMWMGKRDGIPAPVLKRFVLVAAVSALLGARLLHILTNLSFYQETGFWNALLPSHGGMVAYGGFLGGLAGGWLFARRTNLPLLKLADITTPALAAGLGITRIGCLLYGCDYGKPIGNGSLQGIGMQFPNWSTAYPHLQQHVDGAHHALSGSPAFLHHLHDGLVQQGDTLSAHVYPTQLLSSLNGWIALGLILAFRKRATVPGQLFLAFAAYYGITRTLIELLRGDIGRGFLLGLSTSQWIGLTTAIVAIALYRKTIKTQ